MWLTRLVSCRCSCYCLFVTSVVSLLSSPFPPSDFDKVLDQVILPKQASHSPHPIQAGGTSPVWFLSLSPFLGQDCASACFGFPLFLVIPFNKVFDQVNLQKQMLSPTTHPHKNLLYGVCFVCFFSTHPQTTDWRCYLQTSWRTGYRYHSGTQGTRFPSIMLMEAKKNIVILCSNTAEQIYAVNSIS